MPPFKTKKAICIRVDESVLNWFKTEQPARYQTLMHSVLADYVASKKERASWILGRAQEIFRQYHAQCFWHYDKNLEVKNNNLQLVIDGLRAHGGRKGWLLAEELCR